MWSYYGTKKRISKFYPKPCYNIIIEPFCGAAQYSLYGDNWKKQIFLYDKYVVVAKLWEWLIKHATKKDILSLPDMNIGDKVDDFNLSTEEKWLIGFCINSASSQPKKTVGKYNSWNRSKIEISDNLYKIKHWVINNMSYKDIAKNEEATWFIDPPYQYGGEWYHSSVKNTHLNFDSLAEWCVSRNGQIIVCENSKATWLPFDPLIEMNGQLHKTTEVMWTNKKDENSFDLFF